jgi:hypothetical protein
VTQSTKSQADHRFAAVPDLKQIPMSKGQMIQTGLNRLGQLEFRPWSLFVIWCLMFGFSKALALALLMSRISANDVHPSLAAHDLAVLANPFDARSNFHGADSGRLSESD